MKLKELRKQLLDDDKGDLLDFLDELIGKYDLDVNDDISSFDGGCYDKGEWLSITQILYIIRDL